MLTNESLFPCYTKNYKKFRNGSKVLTPPKKATAGLKLLSQKLLWKELRAAAQPQAVLLKFRVSGLSFSLVSPVGGRWRLGSRLCTP